MTLLRLGGVRLALGGPALLDGLDLVIEERERACLVGRNGAGKTTLLRLLSGAMEPDAGEIHRRQGLRVASLSQEEVTSPQASALDLVLATDPDPWAAPPPAEHRALAALDRLGMEPGARAGALSGGQLRRVFLARALARDADLLLLDEPTNHLDLDTIRWLERCKAAHARPDTQALFGIVQGGTSEEARQWSAERVSNVELPGYAIGGVSVGETSEDIARVVRFTAPLLPASKPRYLMGVGYPRDIVAAVCAGVDMFDCVLPSRNGRNAGAFVPEGQIKLRNARFAEDPEPLEPGCDCPACQPTAGRPASRAYIRHLFMCQEMLGPILVSLHNLRFYQKLMIDLRATIIRDDWAGFAARWPCAASGIPQAAYHAPRVGPSGVGEL